MHELEKVALFARDLRKEIVKMVGRAGTGHPGGSLSAADIVAMLYCSEMRYDPANPGWEDRDRFILSKGHAAPVLYAALAKVGYFPENVLESFREFGSILQGHPDCRKTPGVEISTGSLGQGLSIGGGMAFGLRLRKSPARVYVLLGDGEIQEGQVWEAAMAIAHYKLSNLIAIVDNNGLQIDGPVEQVMNVNPIDAKFEAFGWRTIVVDGHDLSALQRAFAYAKESSDKPTAIVAKTVKGKGVSYMENKVEYHHAKDLPAELVEVALRELGENGR